MVEKHITSQRGNTYYWIGKSRNSDAGCLVFLPGLTANHHLFDYQIPYFEKRYTVLVWDAPAHGKSRPYKDFSYSHLAEELKAILDMEGIRQVILIGQSAGGFVAQSFVSGYPAMVTGILTIGSCPYGTVYYSKSDIFWLQQTEWMARLFTDKLLRKTMAWMCGTTDRGRQNMRRMLEDYDKKELCHLMYLGLAGFIPEIRDRKIPCPVCLVVGDNDRTGKVRKYNEQWHEREGCLLHIIKGASHNANVDKPEELNRIIERFAEEASAAFSLSQQGRPEGVISYKKDFL